MNELMKIAPDDELASDSPVRAYLIDETLRDALPASDQQDCFAWTVPGTDWQRISVWSDRDLAEGAVERQHGALLAAGVAVVLVLAARPRSPEWVRAFLAIPRKQVMVLLPTEGTQLEALRDELCSIDPLVLSAWAAFREYRVRGVCHHDWPQDSLWEAYGRGLACWLASDRNRERLRETSPCALDAPDRVVGLDEFRVCDTHGRRVLLAEALPFCRAASATDDVHATVERLGFFALSSARVFTERLLHQSVGSTRVSRASSTRRVVQSAPAIMRELLGFWPHGAGAGMRRAAASTRTQASADTLSALWIEWNEPVSGGRVAVRLAHEGGAACVLAVRPEGTAVAGDPVMLIHRRIGKTWPLERQDTHWLVMGLARGELDDMRRLYCDDGEGGERFIQHGFELVWEGDISC